MMALPFPWCIYEENQSKAAQSRRINDAYWGIENGLTRILEAVESRQFPDNQEELRRNIDRSIATGAWNERHHARLQSQFLQPESAGAAEDSRIIARSRLATIRSNVGSTEWAILKAVGFGFSYSEIAKRLNATAGSVRTLVSRLRKSLRTVEQLGEGVAHEL